MTRYLAALIGVLASVLIGCSGTNQSTVMEKVLEAEPSEVLEQAVKAMEDNPRFGVVVGWLDSGGEQFGAYAFDLQFIIPDRFSTQQAPGYEVIPFIIVIDDHTYASPDGIHWEELQQETGAEWYWIYYLRWNPYEFLKHAGDAVDGGTASLDGKPCRIIEADVYTDSWGNGTGWVTDRTSVGLVVYADVGNFLPYRVTVLWREEFPQGTTEYPYVIDISYDETITIEHPEEILPKDELRAIAYALNPVIEDRAGELVWIISAFEEANGIFPDRIDLETLDDVMRTTGLQWPTNPATGAPMADEEPIPGNFFYLPIDDGSNYQLSVYKVDTNYNGACFTYHGSPVGPTTIPWLTDEQEERALEVALADPHVIELLEDRPYDIGSIGPSHMGSNLLAAIVDIELREPCIIEYDWPFASINKDLSLVEKGTRHITAGVETLVITVNLEEERVVEIEPQSFRVFR